MSSILEMRKELIQQNKKDSPEIINRARERQGRMQLDVLTGKQSKYESSLNLNSINNKEELMNMLKNTEMHAPDGIGGGAPAMPQMPQMPGMPGGVTPPVAPQVGAPQVAPLAGGPAGTGINRATQDRVRSALLRSSTFRPKAVVIDKDAANKMVINEEDPVFATAVRKFEEENTETLPDGTIKVKKVQKNRILKEICITNKTNPIDYALKDDQGNFAIEAHKPNVVGAIITFPATETGAEVTEIIKKDDLYSEIQARGGAGIIGNINEQELDKSKFEIPVNFVVTPTKRKSKKTGEFQESEKITVATSKNRKQQWFPEARIVSMFNMFDVFPKEDYQLNRVIPRRVHDTVDVGGQQLAVIEITEADRDTTNDKISLARYKVVDNPLSGGYQGAEIAQALGVDGGSLSTAFEPKRASASLEKNTQEDLINAYVKDLNKKASKEFQYMNFLKSFQRNN